MRARILVDTGPLVALVRVKAPGPEPRVTEASLAAWTVAGLLAAAVGE